MTLTQQEIEFIKANMATWLAEQSLGKPPAVYEIWSFGTTVAVGGVVISVLKFWSP